MLTSYIYLKCLISKMPIFKVNYQKVLLFISIDLPLIYSMVIINFLQKNETTERKIRLG